MEAYFSQYRSSGFNRDPEAGLIVSFNALAISQSWAPEDISRARVNFRSAMVAEFNARYGTNEKDLRSWQNLCTVFNIQPVPGSINKCREEIKKVHVNLVDLIELPQDNSEGVPTRVFPSVKALRKYTKKTGKFFPKKDAKAGGILKNLLRHLLSHR